VLRSFPFGFYPFRPIAVYSFYFQKGCGALRSFRTLLPQSLLRSSLERPPEDEHGNPSSRAVEAGRAPLQHDEEAGRSDNLRHVLPPAQHRLGRLGDDASLVAVRVPVLDDLRRGQVRRSGPGDGLGIRLHHRLLARFVSLFRAASIRGRHVLRLRPGYLLRSAVPPVQIRATGRSRALILCRRCQSRGSHAGAEKRSWPSLSDRATGRVDATTRDRTWRSS
jgi:hypothetical protein